MSIRARLDLRRRRLRRPLTIASTSPRPVSGRAQWRRCGSRRPSESARSQCHVRDSRPVLADARLVGRVATSAADDCAARFTRRPFVVARFRFSSPRWTTCLPLRSSTSSLRRADETFCHWDAFVAEPATMEPLLHLGLVTLKEKSLQRRRCAGQMAQISCDRPAGILRLGHGRNRTLPRLSPGAVLAARNARSAVHSSGSTWTTSFRRHSAQKRGGSVAALRAWHRAWSDPATGRPQPSQ